MTVLRLFFVFVLLAVFPVLVASPAQAADPEIPFLKLWQGSPHADVKSESFVHWDKDGAVPKACAKCHSGPGYQDFVGADGSAPGVIDKDAPIHAVVDCVTCHNPQTQAMRTVDMPSGVRLVNLCPSARCMQCHQGRAAGADVEKATAGKDADTADKDLKFINSHYAVAGATLWGSAAKGAYEYPKQSYAGQFVHPESANECAECHDPHSLKVQETSCAACHGDGAALKAVKTDVEKLHGQLLAAIMDYAKKTARRPIGYEAHSYPYFFTDKNGDGQIDKAEAKRDNGYVGWTPRLLKAAYNYQFVAKDKGAYAHNPAYAKQVLHDSLKDLGADTGGAMRP